MNTFYTKRDELTENIMGTPVSDPYRWLEDEENPEVKEWIAVQNMYTERNLQGVSFKIFQEELSLAFSETVFSVPVPGQGRHFYQERNSGDQQFSLYLKKEMDGEPICVVNPNELNSDGTTTISHWAKSRLAVYVAYELSVKGTEMGTVYIKNIDTGEILPDQLERCSHTSIAWLPDDSGFFYERHPYLGEVPANEEHLHPKVYFHALGTKQERDALVFGEGRPKDDMISLKISPNGNHLAVQVAQKWTQNDIYVYDIVKKTISPLIVGKVAKFSLYFSERKAFLLTNYKADRYRVLSAPIETWADTPIDGWTEFIPEGLHTLDSIAVSKSKLLAHYLANVCSEVRVYDHVGKMEKPLPLPSFSAIHSIQARYYDEEFFYGVKSFTIPFAVYRYNPDTKNYEEYRTSPNPIRPEDYEVSQEWCMSKDGTRIPLFVFYKKGIEKNSKNPLVLYGYGAHGSSLRPSFWKSFVPWVTHGGVFAVANIRGGGEFGKSWQEAGSGVNKQNCLDDFIATAEHLVSQKYTDAQRLGIYGGSMGGTLVSAVSVQRPDLFKAVCVEVGITDIVRFPLFGMAVRWVGELGDPQDEKGLRAILKWSPYHNVKEGTEYPAHLFITGENDTRVNPLHSRKMTAMLQSVNKENDIFIFTEKEAGHGAGKPIKKIVEGAAYILSFFAKELGLKV